MNSFPATVFNFFLERCLHPRSASTDCRESYVTGGCCYGALTVHTNRY